MNTNANRNDSVFSSGFSVAGKTLLACSLSGVVSLLGVNSAHALGQGCGQPVTSLNAFGFEQTAVGDALLEIDCITGHLKVSNLGSSGCDGVSIDLGDSDGIEYVLDSPIDPAMTPDGTVLIGVRSYGPAGSQSLVCEDIGNLVEFRTAFDGLGVTSRTLRVFDLDPSTGEKILVEEVTGQTGPWDFRIGGPPVPNANFYQYEFADCAVVKCCLLDPGTLSITVNGGNTVSGNFVEVVPENYTPVGLPSTFTLRGGGMSELVVVEESILQFPMLPHQVVGQAVIEPPTDKSSLKISNLGSSGCDGVSIDLGEGDFFQVTMEEINDGNSIPDGAFTECQVRGTVGGEPDQLISTARITDIGADLELSVTGGPATTYLVRMLLGEAVVFESGGESGRIRVPASTPCKSESHAVNLLSFLFLGAEEEKYVSTWGWDSPTTLTIPGGPSIVADQLQVIPEGTPAPELLTEFTLRGADIGSFEIADEQLFFCRGGTVGSSTGSSQDVLLVNGSVGSLGNRKVEMGVSQSIEVSLNASSMGPAQGKYFLAAWIGGPQTPLGLSVQGQLVGCFVNPIPLTGGDNQPFRCLRGGLPGAVCRGVRELPSPPTAPFSATKAGGLSNPLTITVQALLEDNGSAHPIGYSVTNAVVIEVN